VDFARRCLDPAPAVRFRDAGQVARVITAYFATADERARAAEHDAAAARAVAASERRARRLTGALAGVILGAFVLGGVGSLWAMRQQVRAVRAELRAEGDRLRSEREHRERVEGALEVLLATEQKGQFLISQAAGVEGRNAAKWADMIATCRAVAERVARATPDEAARRRALNLADRLRAEEADLRRRSASADGGTPPQAHDLHSPREK
jgi:hypothetical protein